MEERAGERRHIDYQHLTNVFLESPYPADGEAEHGRNFLWFKPSRIIRRCFGEL
jgi:hypothetical protein